MTLGSHVVLLAADADVDKADNDGGENEELEGNNLQLIDMKWRNV